jgi:hypothetical protein
VPALAARDLGARDAALLAMLLRATPTAGVASALGEPPRDVEEDRPAPLRRLSVKTATAT